MPSSASVRFGATLYGDTILLYLGLTPVLGVILVNLLLVHWASSAADGVGRAAHFAVRMRVSAGVHVGEFHR